MPRKNYYIITNIQEHGVYEERLALGFTFSFPLKQLGLTKGILQRWTKGFSCSGVVGEDVVQGLKDAIARRGVRFYFNNNMPHNHIWSQIREFSVLRSTFSVLRATDYILGRYPKHPDQYQFRKSLSWINNTGIEPGIFTSNAHSASRWATEVVRLIMT